MELRILGTFEVTIDALAVSTFPTDKIRALITYLALESRFEIDHLDSRPHRREVLASLLWPDMPDASALTNLRLALHRMRQTLDQAAPGAGDALLTITRHTVQLTQAALTIDAITFQTLLATCAAHTHGNIHSCEECQVRLAEAVDLYRGELLAGFGLADAPAFEEWLLLRREMFHQQALTALHSLVIGCEQRGDDYQAHVYASRQISLDPYREEAHRQLMRILARRGLYSEALAQFESCRRLLLEGLGVEPDNETIALLATLRSEDASGVLSRHGVIHSNTALTALRHALPAPLAPLTGREDELKRINELLGSDNTQTRLVSIMGVGGVGKTRLALAAAWALYESFADGAVWVSLSRLVPVADPASQDVALATAVGTALGLSFDGRSAPFDIVCRTLEERALLLVLDNCEHLMVATFVHELLAAAPQLRVLITTRSRLNVQGEVLLRLEGLPVPEPNADDPACYAGVQLFLAQARRHGHDLQSNSADLTAVARLCRLLEGMPLSIELAARWVGHYTCDEIASEMEANIDFLAVRSGDMPDRHRSLRAVFDYSWMMLHDAERQALARLAIFKGVFDRTAAQAIADTQVTTLAALVDASLLRHLGVGRYSFHELVRQFAATRLADSGETAALAERHARYYLDLVANQETSLYGATPKSAAIMIRDISDHIQQAWNWAVAHDAWDKIARCLPTVRQYVRIHNLFYEYAPRIMMAAAQLDAYLERGDAAREDVMLLSRLRGTAAYFLERQELRSEATIAAQTAITLAVAANDPIGEAYGYLRLSCAALSYLAVMSPLETEPVIAWLERAIILCRTAQPAVTMPLERRYLIEIEAESLLYLSSISIKLGHYATACAQAEQALALARANSDRMQESRALNFYAETLENAGRYEQAYEQRVAMLTLARTNGSSIEEYVALNNLSCTLIHLGDYRGALEHARAALRGLDTHVRNPYDLANSYHTLSWAACRYGETALALETAQQSLAFVQSTHVPQYQTLPLLALGDALLGLQQYDEARNAYAKALGLGQEHQMLPLVAVALAGIARCELAKGLLTNAHTAINELLRNQDVQALGSIWEPLRVAEICYRVLDACGDPRSSAVLQAAAAQLNQQANAITNVERRRIFCEQVAANRVIIEASTVAISTS